MGWLGKTWSELKERRVIRAAVVFVAAFWLLLQMGEVLVESAIIGDLWMRWLILGGVALFPVTLIIAWYYEHPWHDRKGLALAGDLALLAAIVLATGLLAWQQWESLTRRPVVAVLGLESTDAQSTTPALASHLSNRIRDLLAVTPSLWVIEPESAQHPSLRGLPLTERAQQLNADYLVAGTVNQTSMNVRISLQLFDRQGELIWSERYRDRLIDQHHLQTTLLEGLWPLLGTPEAELVRIIELLNACDYPTDPEAVVRLAAAEWTLPVTYESTPGETVRALAQAIKLLDELVASYTEKGLPLIARARLRMALMDHSPPASRPLMHKLVIADLDQAGFHCPSWPDLERLRLAATDTLEADPNNWSDLLERHPNDAALRGRLAGKAAEDLAREACTLNPLSSEWEENDSRCSR